MQQSFQHENYLKIQKDKYQNLQLNRLLQFIQNKKSTSLNKLKSILIGKDIQQNKTILLSDRLDRQLKIHEISQLQSVAVNTKNIFVARNKTQSSSPRVPQDIGNKYYKIFVTKQEILKLHEKQRSQYLSPNMIKQKYNFIANNNPEQKLKSNLFPPLSVPKLKRPIMFKKYQDQTTQWLNSDIKNIKNNNQGQEEESKNKIDTQKLHNIHLQRQKYNKSLQKLIQKAFKNKNKYQSIHQNNKILIQGIQGYDSKLIVQGEHYDSDNQNQGQSVYASKGKLLSNPNIKIKRDTRLKSQKRNKKTTIQQIPYKIAVNQKQAQSIIDSEHKKRIIHTNRQAYYLSSSSKLKTQITSKAAQYQPSSIKNHNKTLKLINQLQSSIIKNQQTQQNSKKINSSKEMQKLIESNNEYLQKLIEINQQQQIKKSRRKKYSRKPKIKTLQSETLPSKNKKSIPKWELAGYQWKQSTEDFQQNVQLQNYVEKIVKRSDPITLEQKFKNDSI